MKNFKFNGSQLPAITTGVDGQQKAGEKENSTTKVIGNQVLKEVVLSTLVEHLEVLAKTSAMLLQDMQKSESTHAEEVGADANVKLVDFEEVLFWPNLTDREIQFVECVKPWLKEMPGGRKDLQLSTRQLVNVFRRLGYNGWSQRTIQRRLLTLWYKGVVTDRKLKTFDLQRYVALYYYSKVFVPLMRVFEPLAPVVQDKAMQWQAEQDEWEKRKQLAMGLLNCYLAPWGVRVVEGKEETND